MPDTSHSRSRRIAAEVAACSPVLACWLLLASLVASPASPTSYTPGRTAASEQALGDLAACVIRQIERDPRATPESVAAACAGVAAEDAVKIIFAHRHAAAAAGAAPCGSSSSPAPASSGSK